MLDEEGITLFELDKSCCEKFILCFGYMVFWEKVDGWKRIIPGGSMNALYKFISSW